MDYDPVTLKWLRSITYVVAVALSAFLVWYYGPGVSAAWADFVAVREELSAAEVVSPELSREVIQTRRGLGQAGGEMLFLLTVVLGTAFTLIVFAFSGKRHETSIIHERLAPHLQRYLDHSLGEGADDEKKIPAIDELEDEELEEMLAVLDAFHRDSHTVGSATKTFRELDLLEVYRQCYRMGFITDQGDLILTRLGRKAHKLFRLELLIRRQQQPWLTIPLADFEGRECYQVPDADVFVVNWEKGASAVFGMDPTTGEQVTWRRHRFRGKRSGNIFTADGKVRIGPSEVGLTRFRVKKDDNVIRVNLTDPIEGELSEHRSGIGSRVWTGSSSHQEQNEEHAERESQVGRG